MAGKNSLKKSKNNHLFIFGLGYVGQHLARALHQQGWQITGTTRNPKRLEPNVPNDWKILKFEDGRVLACNLIAAKHLSALAS